MIDCAVIRDLLPLYVDDVLSEESRALIDRHLVDCENCINEFTNMQSEVKKLQHNDEAKIKVLKSIKKKIFRQKVIIAAIASAVAFAIVIGTQWYVTHFDKPIPYTQGLVWVERDIVELLVDGTLTIVPIANAYTTRYSPNAYSISRIINLNGIETEVVFLYISETISSRRISNNRGEQSNRVVHGMGAITTNHEMGNALYHHSYAMEIYYLVAPFKKFHDLSDEDFYAQRDDGVLLWSGTLEQ
jgi:hypothetical protein